MAIALALALAACGKAADNSGPGGVTADEARALDDAAAMLDARQPPPDLYAPSVPQRQPGATAVAR